MATATNFNCPKCGRTILHVPFFDNNLDVAVKAEWIVADSIKGETPSPGDLFHVICKCGKVIITPDCLIKVMV